MKHSEFLASSLVVAEPDAALAFENAVLAFPHLRPLLADNQALTQTSWARLANMPSLPVARALTRRRIPEHLRTPFLERERRGSIIDQILAYNMLSAHEYDIVLRHPLSGTSLKKLIPAPTLELERHVCLRIGELYQLSWLIESGEESDAVLMMSCYSSWAPRQLRPREDVTVRLNLLLERFPILAEVYASSTDNTLREVAAASRHLSDPITAYKHFDIKTVYVLANNPVVTLEQLDQVLEMFPGPDGAAAVRARRTERPLVSSGFDTESDPDTLSWLVERLVQRNNQLVRPWDVCALLANPHLNLNQLARLRQMLTQVEDLGYAQSVVDLWRDHILTVHPEVVFRPVEPSEPEVECWERDYVLDDRAWNACLSRISADKLYEVVGADDLSQLAHGNFLERRAAGDILTQAFGSDSSAWSNFLSLADNFDGSLNELVDITKAL